MCKGGATFSLSLDSNSSNHLRDQCHNKGSRDHDDDDELLPTSTIVSTPSFLTSLTLNSPFEALPVNSSSASGSLFNSLFNKNKRVSEHLEIDDSPGDHWLKRRLKNRESAARSRARRQAYTSELERELAQLTEENAKLREQQKKLTLSAPIFEIPKKRGHCRSLTAPF